ncbi:MAG: carboxylesterase [Mucilaginibacter sp.]|nr:carboxylesterase [Mucilaginibacter sp.]
MKPLKLLAAALVCITVLFSFTAEERKKAEDSPIKIETGLITGVKSKNSDVIAYKGVPFALPPVKELRWKAPQPAKPWTGIRKCATYGPDPVQNPPKPMSMWSEEFLIPKESIRSEDCLYLNVWTTAKPTQEKRPVLVWIYGGGFNSGGADVPIYDGEATATKGIVFVSFNYRVGIFGSFAHPELTKESGYSASGNYGLLDQIAALKWVQKNIAAFGGDPENVTIAGQSAGSMSVNCLIASPLAKNLFQKAIAESGASMVGSVRGMRNLQQATEQGITIAQTLKTTTLADLRNIPAEDLQNRAKGAFGPIVDGYVLPEAIPATFAANKQNNVMLLTGWNENEGMLYGTLKNAEDFRKQAEQTYGANAGLFLTYYPANTEDEATSSQYKLSKDIMFGIQNYTLANVESERGTKVYVYRFTHKVPGTGIYENIGAFHTGEVGYAYDNLKFINRPWQPADHELAHTISSYWANFIKYGNPNGKGLPNWPSYTTNSNQIMILGDTPTAKALPDKAALDLLLTTIKP